MLKTLFRNQHDQLRSGWWIAIFVAILAASRFAYGPVKSGLLETGLADKWLEPLPFILILLVTWACTRLRGEPLKSVGFVLDRRWIREFGAGTLLGATLMALIVAIIWATGGVSLALDPQRSLDALCYGLFMFLCVALFEETLFRGFVFQRLIEGIGLWPAQLALAMLFAAGHWDNPDMQGTTLMIASLDLAIGAMLLGLAYVRTGSLALPVGIHLGWNWAQGHVLGFGVSGYGQQGWFTPEFADKAEWLTGGQFGPEASVFALLVDSLMLLVLWRWKGSRAAANPPAKPSFTSPAIQG
ncbi:CPBP family intramembrane glutamic endopeptidase [Bowmanella dokdonensis]|uniref:CPBP family intramembrane metalloprotease n=1 Tax=Bowmanella dokdonensis TaxID=751969 RepID=A0A939DNY9_9ALTE|nr:type II CAAX endopeptidase family protein [Bowmanella dokdonensis]MBN7825291.1 CPBP family intramembrane metalloprotease [Bowmanella dokdonensis]